MSARALSPVAAALTPFQRSGAVDPAAVRDQLHLLGAARVRALLVNGTTGEFAACTDAERRAVLEAARVQELFDRYGTCRRALPLVDISAAKAALAERLPGFPAAVRPPLIAADAVQARTIGAVVREVLA
ncbi:dihydrodipicolinate synthase family protein [Nocardia harenae]|uniref:dihydrodipicolinate synthase family protein n=1 Tax=Nocardia harenae TaxID=358707 RepID=UPI00082CCE2F|nr:dihydrodipicolinate synthase family protein [Nocardia harenae]